MSAGIAMYLYLKEAALIEQEIDRRVTLRHDLLRQSLQEYESALFGLRLLAEHSEDLTPGEFERAAEQTIGRVPGIQAIQWVTSLSAEELPDFLSRTRGSLLPDFRPRHRLPDGEIVPFDLTQLDPGREDFAIITYVHPLLGNEITAGYDALTGPTAEDLRRAREESGTTVLTRAFALVQGGEGVILICYVPRPQRPDGPPPLGGPGYVQVVLRLDTMLRKAWTFSAQPIIDVVLVDATSAPHVHLFAQIGDTQFPATLGPPPPGFITPDTRHLDLPLGGRLWRAYYKPREDWLRRRRPIAPFFATVGGTLLTLLSVVHLNTLRKRNEHVRREVTERTAQLAESRALLDEIIDHNPSVIWVKGADGRHQLVNLAFAACHGVSREEMIGRTDDFLFPPGEAARLRELDARIFADGKTVSMEDKITVGGRPRTFLVSRFPLRRQNGQIYAVAGIATDITDLREAESARLVVERRLLEAQKLESLAVLAGGVAHDFNNLLTGILGHASLARAQLPATDPVQDSLSRIETASHRAADLCRQMLAYAGRGRLSVASLDLGEFARETVGLLKLSLSRRARLRFELAPALPRVTADPVQIRQIIMNLVLNASEALVDGTGEIAVGTRLVRADAALFAACVFSPELPPGDYVCLEVADTGHGMDEQTSARIFDPFFSTKFTGRGLGLAAVLGIVRGHNGALQVASKPGLGTTFRLYLPAAAADKAAGAPNEARGAKPGAPAPAAPSGPMRPLRVLLVDDDEAVRETVPGLLASCGHRVDACADGETGLLRLREHPRAYDLAILDLTMPGLGGAKLLQRLREVNPGLPVLLVSGYTSEESAAEQLLRLPRVAFLAKPFALAELQGKFTALLAAP